MRFSGGKRSSESNRKAKIYCWMGYCSLWERPRDIHTTSKLPPSKSNLKIPVSGIYPVEALILSNKIQKSLQIFGYSAYYLNMSVTSQVQVQQSQKVHEVKMMEE